MDTHGGDANGTLPTGAVQADLSAVRRATGARGIAFPLVGPAAGALCSLFQKARLDRGSNLPRNDPRSGCPTSRGPIDEWDREAAAFRESSKPYLLY